MFKSLKYEKAIKYVVLLKSTNWVYIKSFHLPLKNVVNKSLVVTVVIVDDYCGWIRMLAVAFLEVAADMVLGENVL